MAGSGLFHEEAFFIGLGAALLLASSVLGALALKGNSSRLIRAFWVSAVLFMLLSSAALFVWAAPWTAIIPLLPVFIMACIYFYIKRT